MNKALLAAAAAAIIATGFASAAEARCVRTGHHWSCTHHRLHYSHRPHYRAWAAGYGYRYAHPYYGSSYPSYGLGSSGLGFSGSSSLGPRPSSDSGS